MTDKHASDDRKSPDIVTPDHPTVVNHYDFRGSDLSRANNAIGSSGFSQGLEPFPYGAPMHLGQLVELVVGGDLPLVSDLNPYSLGATSSAFGNAQDFGRHDPYVPRLHNDVDERLRKALDCRGLVLVAGPSKAGKTRTCFEAIRRSSSTARLLAPLPGTFARLVEHPRLRNSTDDVVVWLDDLDRFIAHSNPLTPALVMRLMSRPGSTIAIATLRSEARARLRATSGELTRETRLLLDQAHTILLAPTSEDPAENASASRSYPGLDLRHGLAADLAGAPALLEQHEESLYSDPVQHAVVDAVIDWSRAGRTDPLPEQKLVAGVIEALKTTRFDLEVDDEHARDAIRCARTPQLGAGRVAALITHRLHADERGYRPFDYLVAAADGQDRAPRPIPNWIWRWVLDDADGDTAVGVGISADLRGNTTAAAKAFTHAAVTGHPIATRALAFLVRNNADELDWTQFPSAVRYMPSLHADVYLPIYVDGRVDRVLRHSGDLSGEFHNLGVLFASNWNPDELPAALEWFEQMAKLGDPGAMVGLGILLSERCFPPDLKMARLWYEAAASAGDSTAMWKLSMLLSRDDPPDEVGSELWATRCREANIAKWKRSQT
jgi:TPR repeat protein